MLFTTKKTYYETLFTYEYKHGAIYSPVAALSEHCIAGRLAAAAAAPTLRRLPYCVEVVCAAHRYGAPAYPRPRVR